jgi:hypothetical protein
MHSSRSRVASRTPGESEPLLVQPIPTESGQGFHADVPKGYARRRTLRDQARRLSLRIARAPRRLLRGPLQFWCALSVCAYSFRGHTRGLLSRRWWGVDLGPFYELQPDGSLQENRRTKSRKLCIESIAASRPWASTVDLEILLEGFDWGERFALGNPCIQPRTETAASSDGDTGAIVPDSMGRGGALQAHQASGSEISQTSHVLSMTTLPGIELGTFAGVPLSG